jgi:hypothetical protein
VTQATHTRLIRWLWHSLYAVEWIRRYLRTPPDWRTPEERQAFHQWHIEAFAHNRRLLERRIGREELERRDRRFLADCQRLRESARARGFTGADQLVRPF